MKNISQLLKKLDELEKATDENNHARVVIYDPEIGTPEIDNDSDGVIFFIPDNGRDYSPGNNTRDHEHNYSKISQYGKCEAGCS